MFGPKGTVRLLTCVFLGMMAISEPTWSQVQLFSPTPTTGQSFESVASIDESRAIGFGKSAIPVRVNREQLAKLARGAEATVSLPGGQQFTLQFDLVKPHGDGITTWVGSVKEFGRHYRAILTSGPNGTFGSIRTPVGEFRLVPGNGNDWLLDMVAEQPYLPIINLGNDGIVPPESSKRLASQPAGEPTFVTPIPGINTVGFEKAAPSPQAVVDIMMVVTSGLAARLGGNLMTRMHFLVERANTAYADSEIAITMRLVHVHVANYPDNTDDSAALNAITPVSGSFNATSFGQVETLRSAFGADFVALLRDGGDFFGSGLAWLPTPGDASRMYSVTTGCVQGCESVFIHEVGHNMGNAHDRATASWQANNNPSPPQGAFSYSFGYYYCESGQLSCNPAIPALSGTCDFATWPGNGGPACGCRAQNSGGTGPSCSTSHANNFGTIMSYFNPGVYRFSNPLQTCMSTEVGAAAKPCGSAEGNSNAADNAKSMNALRATYSAIRSTAIATLPGSLQFTSVGYSALESAGSITFTVSRIGGSAGAVSVAYGTSDGTAKAGLDYVAASGTLNWADGDASNKTFTVNLINDGLSENSESFVVSLSNASGANGIYIGSPGIASGTILEPWPAGGVLPSGFVTPDGSSGAWAVATDRVNEGTHSLRSAATLSSDPQQQAFANSDLSFTGTFSAGTISFDYQVSAYPGYGFLELLVDNTVVFSDTGAAGWKSTSYQISAGNHTVKWRFKNRLNFQCSLVGGPTPPPPSCADRAWIDSLAMPVALSSPTFGVTSSANPSTPGQSVTFTANVSGAAGTPTGFVVFRDGASTIAGCGTVTLVTGTAQCVTSTLPVGTRPITAQYSGNATYQTTTSSVLNQTVNSAVAAASSNDFNSDGKPDLIWSNTTSGATYIWRMNGVSLLSDQLLATIDPVWKVQGVADFNGDGHNDIVWRHTGTGNTYVWYLVNGVFQSDAFLFSLPPQWVIQGVADFNKDGKPDFLMRNTSSGNAFVWFFNNASPIGDQFLFNIDPAWKVEGVADLNADGQPDLLFRNINSGLAFAWNSQFNAGALSLTTSTPPIFSIDYAWEIVQVSDWNADGKPDLVFRNKNTGVVFVWYMNGTTLTTSNFIIQIDPTWEVVPRR